MDARIANVYRLGVKELWGLWRDPVMLVLVVFFFTVSIYTQATSMPDTLNKAPIAIVDEDRSPLSERIVSAFYPPQFLPSARASLGQVDAGLDAGEFTFALIIPSGFQRDVLAGRQPAIQLNVDATRMAQAFSGSGYAQQIVLGEVAGFVARNRANTAPNVDLALRARFNPTLDHRWFGSVMAIINNITLLSILLTGAALIREREHGTIEHLLVMPVTPMQIMVSKVWSMGLVVLLAAAFSLFFVVQGLLDVGIEGSIALFLCVAALHLFATTSMGIFMATMTRTMPQFAMLLILVLLPLQMLSGASTPRESMPLFVQEIMLAAPTTHFVAAAQAILYRGAGASFVWPQMLWLAGIGATFFTLSRRRFNRTLGQMA